MTQEQEALASYVWMLARHREALARQLADVEQFERDAVAAAGQFGVKQAMLATLTGKSPGRISQIISATPADFEAAPQQTREQWRQVLDDPAGHLERYSGAGKTIEELDDWNAKHRLIHGED
ncbi:hypothetical protein [Arthrobacter sp. 35W]|uniref:hypothetical protein n=1 Tax=Arthrobacter sp. 35W TaxID=1132441 RepID=UPI00041B2D09|nr:hypothetical protein [Arthrobacter sp. 35W]